MKNILEAPICVPLYSPDLCIWILYFNFFIKFKLLPNSHLVFNLEVDSH